MRVGHHSPYELRAEIDRGGWVLHVVRLLEAEPSIVGISAHFLVVAPKSG
jgi:hypothetical protein